MPPELPPRRFANGCLPTAFGTRPGRSVANASSSCGTVVIARRAHADQQDPYRDKRLSEDGAQVESDVCRRRDRATPLQRFVTLRSGLTELKAKGTIAHGFACGSPSDPSSALDEHGVLL